jgi:DNA polymerase II large subunit
MSLLGVLLLISPLANVDFDIAKALPEAEVVISREVVVKAIEKNRDKDQPELEVLHFLGRARAYGFHEVNFVIRAASKEHANTILEHIVSRFNASEDVQERHRQGMGLFKFAVISDEATNAEIHKFVENTTGKPGSLLFVDGGLVNAT